MQQFGFHPLIAEWFSRRFSGPTEPQRHGWPAISAGGPTLIAAPTGSGKTLTAFLAVIDGLFREAEAGELTDKIRVVYLSPLRALSNDMHRNLEVPLREIAELAAESGLDVPAIRVGLRTGDTTASQRAAIVKRPPHLLVTTPESLYLMLTSERGREALAEVGTVIVDEIHALVRDKRGSHMALTLERLEALSARPIQRIGLSATQKPLDRIAAFLVGQDRANECQVIDIGHQRTLDLALDVPVAQLGAVCTHEQWADVHQRLGELINSHRSTLIFVNTRRMAERLTHQLSELLGDEHVSSHHGSLSAEIRHQTERRLKTGELKAVVATASLELGLDVGYIDLVVQLGSCRSIATFLQRIGRSGHSLHATPKGRIIPLSRDEAIECMALIRSIRQGTLDAVRIPEEPLDVLVQQVVAEVTCREWGVDELFALCRRAWPYRHLSREVFEDTLQFLSEGLTERSGRSRSLIYYDRIGQRVKARPRARAVAVGNAGAIPDTGSYRVVAQPENTVIGSVDEDFAVESTRGDVFLLGNTSWRIEHVRHGDVVVSDAHGAPPSIPFWFGEGPGRTIELSTAVSELREEIARRAVAQAVPIGCDDETAEDFTAPGAFDVSNTLPLPAATVNWLVEETSCPETTAEQIVDYVRAQVAAIGVVPAQPKVVFERFFDESGGMQLVVHAPFGAPITRAWGYAMRKRFCRSFDFELQATADDDGFILSLGPQHSFPIESLFGMLTSDNVESLLSQAILVQPPFHLRWRWNVTRALFVERQKFGKKVPPALQRFRAEDLLTSVFPQLTGCLENHTGDIELPDHPLVQQTMHDCLHEAMDIEGLKKVLRRVEAGEIRLVARDTREPSPFCYELLNSSPYAFLDGGEIQERRARTVSPGSVLTADMPPLDWLDPAAIEHVVAEAVPWVRHRDELHDFLMSCGIWPTSDSAAVLSRPQPTPEWQEWFNELVTERRAVEVKLCDGRVAWVAVERFSAVQTLDATLCLPEGFAIPTGVRADWDTVSARIFIARGWLEFCGPVTASELAQHLAWSESQTHAILEALEGEGAAMRGSYRRSPLNNSDRLGDDGAQLAEDWCHRRLLSRIHRRTLAGLRQQIEPVDVTTFQRFLFEYHGLVEGEQRSGANGLYEVLSQLQGLDAAACCWEKDLLQPRLKDYQTMWLDELCLSGEVGWGRLYPPKVDGDKPGCGSLSRVVPLSFYLRCDLPWLLRASDDVSTVALSSLAEEIREHLERSGASFATDLMAVTRMLPSHLEDALGELISRGLVTADTFAGWRTLFEKREAASRNGRSGPPGFARRRMVSTVTGRWSIWRRQLSADPDCPPADRLLSWAWQLLRRWGVVFRELMMCEDGAPAWWEMAPVFRRLEARGEIRGGRFIAGVGGEQFALEATISQLRRHRDTGLQPDVFCVSAADPLNLVGIVTPPPRVPAQASNRVAYLRGVPSAALQGGEVVWLDLELSPADKKRLTAALRGWEPEELEDRHSPRRRQSRTSAEDPTPNVPRPLFS